MSLVFHVVTQGIKGLTRVIFDVHDDQLARVPKAGPLILVGNHVNFLDVPLLYTHLQPRPLTGFAKAETWDNPALGLLFDIWGAIPLQRDEADYFAMKQGIAALKAGKILGVAPEGTRSGNGCLGRGKPGVAWLAQVSGVPMLPVAFHGIEGFRENLPRLKRTEVHIVVGEPFRVASPGGRMTREDRQRAVDEIMHQLAALLPPSYRGVYSDRSAATERYLRFDPPHRSNLALASGAGLPSQ